MTTKTYTTPLTAEQMTARKYIYIMRMLWHSLVITNRLALLHVMAWLKNQSRTMRSRITTLTPLWQRYLRSLDEPGEEVSQLPTARIIWTMIAACLAAFLLAWQV